MERHSLWVIAFVSLICGTCPYCPNAVTLIKICVVQFIFSFFLFSLGSGFYDCRDSFSAPHVTLTVLFRFDIGLGLSSQI